AHHALLFVCFSSTPLAYSSSLSLHDALPICHAPAAFRGAGRSFFVWPSTVNCQLSTLDQNKVGLSDVTRHTLHFTQASPPCPPNLQPIPRLRPTIPPAWTPIGAPPTISPPGRFTFSANR